MVSAKLARCVLFGLAAAAIQAQPAVSSALNAAGYMPSALPNGGLAQSSVIAIFRDPQSTNPIGPAAPAFGSYPLQRTLGGVSVKIGTTDLFIIYASAGQVNAIVPRDTPLGEQPLVVTYNNQPSAPLNVRIVERAFGVITANSAGNGPVLAYKFISQQNQPRATFLEALNPGGTMAFYGTGAGAGATPDDVQSTDPAIPGLDLLNDVEVLIGGKKAAIHFFGRPSWGSAVDQIVATLPEDTPTGCFVSLIVTVAGVVSNSTTLPVAPPGQSRCSDLNGYSEAQITAASTTGRMNQGLIELSKTTSEVLGLGFLVHQVTDSMTAAFRGYTFQQLMSSQGADVMVSAGSCRVLTFEGDEPIQIDPARPTILDAGLTLEARSPFGTQILEKDTFTQSGYLQTVISSSGFPGLPNTTDEFLTAGQHTVVGFGGLGPGSVGSFAASIEAPPELIWTNKNAISVVDRGDARTVTWTGGDPQGFVSISGHSITSVAGKNIGAAFTCIENAAKRSFTIPEAITASLPVSATDELQPMGRLSVMGMSKAGAFSAPGLDAGFIYYRSGTAKTVPYR